MASRDNMSPLNFDPRNDGFWGDTTATLDWCETNYEVSWYIAEFWNTITNLSMILPPLWGIYRGMERGLEKRFLVGFSALLLVGVGSTMFHMTLQYKMQLLDEIPMVWSSCAFVYCQHMVPFKLGERAVGMLVLLFSYCCLFTGVYLTWPYPIIHQVMYGILVFYMIYQAVVILRKSYNPASVRLFLTGILMYGTGFLLWNIDNELCSSVQQLRSGLPPLLAPLTQLHGWWHLFAGYATYMNIQFCLYHRLHELDLKPQYTTDLMGVAVLVAKPSKD